MAVVRERLLKAYRMWRAMLAISEERCDGVDWRGPEGVVIGGAACKALGFLWQEFPEIGTLPAENSLEEIAQAVKMEEIFQAVNAELSRRAGP